MKKKDKKQNKSQYDKEDFFRLLNKAIKPLDSSKERKRESRTSDDYSGKQTRQRKVEDAED